MRKQILRFSPAAIGIFALVCSLNASEWGRFRLPYQEKVEPLWQQWRADTARIAKGDVSGCPSTNPRTQAIDLPTWAELKKKRVEELNPAILVGRLGNPACLLPDGTMRYVASFTDATIDIKLSSKGVQTNLVKGQP